MNLGFSATSTDSVKNAKNNLTKWLKKLDEIPNEILQEEAANIETDAIIRAPLDTGKLESSVKVKVSQSKTNPGISISASAISSKGYNYAGIQHENTEFIHPIKGQAHYLSEPFNRGVNRIKRRWKTGARSAFTGNVRYKK